MQGWMVLADAEGKGVIHSIREADDTLRGRTAAEAILYVRLHDKEDVAKMQHILALLNECLPDKAEPGRKVLPTLKVPMPAKTLDRRLFRPSAKVAEELARQAGEPATEEDPFAPKVDVGPPISTFAGPLQGMPEAME